MTETPEVSNQYSFSRKVSYSALKNPLISPNTSLINTEVHNHDTTTIENSNIVKNLEPNKSLPALIYKNTSFPNL